MIRKAKAFGAAPGGAGSGNLSTEFRRLEQTPYSSRPASKTRRVLIPKS